MTNEFCFGDGKKLNINDFKREVKEGKLSRDEKFKKILSAFDVNKNGTADDGEIDELFGKIIHFANKNGNSVFEDDEAKDFLKSSNIDMSTAQLFGFFSTVSREIDVKKQSDKIFKSGKMDGTTQSTEAVQDNAIELLDRTAHDASVLFVQQKENQGVVSYTYNELKEFFGSDMAATKVYAQLEEDKLTAFLLQRAKEGNLDEKEYWEFKAGLAEKLAEETGDKSFLEQADIYKQNAARVTGEQGLVTTTERVITGYKKSKKDGSKMEAIYKDVQKSHEVTVYPKMSFEQVFKAERGIEFNEEAIEAYSRKEAETAVLVNMHNQKELIKSELAKVMAYYEASKTSTEYMMDSSRIMELRAGVYAVFKRVFGSDERIAEILDRMGLSGNLNPFENNDELGILAIKAAEALNVYMDKNFELACGDKSFEEHKRETTELYQKAYGNKNSNDIAQEFIRSQKEGVGIFKAGVQTAGMVIMIAGQFVPAGNIATAMIWGGLATATVGGAAVGAAESATQKGGMTRQDAENILKELEISVALTATGMGIGKMTSSLYGMLVLKNCPMLLAKVAEIGADATLSLISAYVLTGEIDLKGESLSQLIPILTGILKSKGFKSYLKDDFRRIHVESDTRPVKRIEDVEPKPEERVSKPVPEDPGSHKYPETKITEDKIIEQASEYGIPRENVQKLNSQEKTQLFDNIEILESVIKDLPIEQGRLIKKMFADNPEISKSLATKSIREIIADMDFSKIPNGKTIKRNLDNAAVSHNFKVLLDEIGVKDEATKTLLTRFMMEASNRIDSDMQADITDAQLQFIKDKGATTENTYILAPQPTGTANLKSYTNSARDLIEISQTGNSGLKLNPDNAAVEINGRKLFPDGELGKKFIVVSDDCSISGASILEDTLCNINLGNNLKVGQDVEIVFSPTVIGKNAQKTINKFIDLYERISPDDIRELEKRVSKAQKNGTQPDLTGLSEDALDLYKLVKYDITDNHNDKNQQNNIIKLLKNCKCNKGGKVSFSLADVSGQYPAQKALDYRETETYKNATPEEKNEIDTWMTADGQTWGYRQNATLVSIEGYRSQGYDFIGNTTSKDSKRALGIDENNQTRTNLPVRGNAPNNNTVLSQIFARAAGVDNSRIKVSGLIPPESYYKLMMHNLTTSINPTYIGNQKVGKNLSLEFAIKKGGLSDGKIKIGNKEYDAENCKIEIMTEDGDILYSKTLHGVPKGTPMAQTVESYRNQLNPDVLNDSQVSVLYGAKKIDNINDKALEELGIQENYVFAIPKEYSDKIVVKVNGEVIIP